MREAIVTLPEPPIKIAGVVGSTEVKFRRLPVAAEEIVPPLELLKAMELTAIVPEASSTDAQFGPGGGENVKLLVSLIAGATPPSQFAELLQLPELTSHA